MTGSLAPDARTSAEARRASATIGQVAARCAGLLLLWSCSDSHDVRPDGGNEPDGLPGVAVIDERGCRPDAEFLLGGGRRAQGCSGECEFDLSLASVLDLGSTACIGYVATLRVANERGELLYTVRADLSDGSWDRAAIIAAALESEVLQRRYGCPDCAAIASWVLTRGADDQARPHAFPRGEPPEELANAHRYSEGLIDQLRACQGADLLTCSRAPAL